MSRAFEDVILERKAQDKRWGEQNHPNGTGYPEQMERADIARKTCDAAFGLDRGTWYHILAEEFWEAMAESDPAKLRTELIQTAAVAIAWVEAIDRGAQRPKGTAELEDAQYEREGRDPLPLKRPKPKTPSKPKKEKKS